MDSKSKGQSIALAVVALLAGVLIGIVGASVFNMEDQTAGQLPGVQTDITEAGSDFRVATNRLLVEHVNLAAVSARNILDDSADSEASVAALTENAEELAAVLGSVYGDRVETDFLSLWQSQADSLAGYMLAVREGDREAMTQAETDFRAYGEEVAVLVSENSELEQEDLSDDFNEYADQLLQIANSYVAENHAESFRVQREATQHMAALADTISAATVERFPDRF